MSILLILAILPGIIFMARVWKLDKIEKEPAGLLVKLFISGVLVVIPVAIMEVIFEETAGYFLVEGSYISYFVTNFICVALVEEFGKYIVTKKVSWRHEAFDYQFDGIIYAVCTSIGFAVIENVFYVLDNGLIVALLRAVLAVPGHGFFGIAMGYYYGMAKRMEVNDDPERMKACLWKAVLVPTVLHGFYDFCLSVDNGWFVLIFIVFVVVFYANAYKKVKQFAREDAPLIEKYVQEEAGDIWG